MADVNGKTATDAEAKSGVELFRELWRVYPVAEVEDYYKAGVWKDDLMRVDFKLIQAHRAEGGAPEPPPLEEVPMPQLPRAQLRIPPMASGGMRILPVAQAVIGVRPPSVIAPTGARAAAAARAREQRVTGVFAAKHRLEPAKVKELLAELLPALRRSVLVGFKSAGASTAASELEAYVKERREQSALEATATAKSDGTAEKKQKAGEGENASEAEEAAAKTTAKEPPLKGSVEQAAATKAKAPAAEEMGLKPAVPVVVPKPAATVVAPKYTAPTAKPAVVSPKLVVVAPKSATAVVAPKPAIVPTPAKPVMAVATPKLVKKEASAKPVVVEAPAKPPVKEVGIKLSPKEVAKRVSPVEVVAKLSAKEVAAKLSAKEVTVKLSAKVVAAKLSMKVAAVTPGRSEEPAKLEAAAKHAAAGAVAKAVSKMPEAVVKPAVQKLLGAPAANGVVVPAKRPLEKAGLAMDSSKRPKIVPAPVKAPFNKAVGPAKAAGPVISAAPPSLKPPARVVQPEVKRSIVARLAGWV